MMIDILMNILFNLFFFGFFALFYFLLHLSEKKSNRFGSYFLYGLAGFMFVLFVFLGVLFHLIAMLMVNTDWNMTTNGMPFPIPPQEFPKVFHRFGFSLWIPSLIALLFYIPWLRKKMAIRIPIEPMNRIHTITLMLSMLILIQMAMTYSIGIDTLSAMETETDVWSLIAGIWSQDLMFAFIGLVGVGFWTKRNFKESLQRLGIEKPTKHQVIWGFAIAIGLVVIAYLLEVLLIQTNIANDPDIQEYTEKLIGPLFTTIPGILTLGLAAAIGEETIFRGALQPRFGILLTSLLFALVHSNYGLSISTLIVFGVGLCLGLVRARFNTTTAMIIHAIYNMSLGFISYFHS